MLIIQLSVSLVIIALIRVAELQAGAIGGGSRNDYGPPVYISSGVLQLTDNDGTERNDVKMASVDPWAATGLSAGYDVWLDADIGLQNYQPTQNHRDEGVSNVVFSVDPTRIPPGTGLHTQVIASKPYKPPPISDNIDFNSVVGAPKTNQNYKQSYGR